MPLPIATDGNMRKVEKTMRFVKDETLIPQGGTVMLPWFETCVPRTAYPAPELPLRTRKPVF